MLVLINTFRKVVRYQISTEMSVVFLYTCDELSEKEIKKTIPFTIALRRIKYLGINLTKEAKDLYTKKCWKKLKKTQINGNYLVFMDWKKTVHSSLSICGGLIPGPLQIPTRRCSSPLIVQTALHIRGFCIRGYWVPSVLLKCHCYQERSTDSVQSLSESQCLFLQLIEKPVLKFIGNLEGPWTTKTILQKNKAGGLTLPDFKTYDRATIIKTMWYRPRDRHIEQWIECPEINPRRYDQVITVKGAQSIQWQERASSQVLGKLDFHVQKDEVTVYPEINSKGIKDLT